MAGKEPGRGSALLFDAPTVADCGLRKNHEEVDFGLRTSGFGTNGTARNSGKIEDFHPSDEPHDVIPEPEA
jgi:hypothetical protein